MLFACLSLQILCLTCRLHEIGQSIHFFHDGRPSLFLFPKLKTMCCSVKVIELDGVVGDVAKRHFGFVENERMQVYLECPSLKCGDYILSYSADFSLR